MAVGSQKPESEVELQFLRVRRVTLAFVAAFVGGMFLLPYAHWAHGPDDPISVIAALCVYGGMLGAFVSALYLVVCEARWRREKR